MINDLRFAFRLWRRHPAFVAAAELTLALGIALNTSLFGVVNAVWFRPPVFPQPERLVFLHQAHERKGFKQLLSGPAYEPGAERAAALRPAASPEPSRTSGGNGVSSTLPELETRTTLPRSQVAGTP